MNTLAVVSLVSLLGWLVLNVSALREYNESKTRLLKLALLWIGVFAGIFALFALFV